MQRLTSEDVRSVSPPLAKYTETELLQELWHRPQLSPRDRSVVTVSVLIARNQTVEMPFHFRRALDNGVLPKELSEILAHLAFYSGWGNANAAVAILQEVFAERGIGPDRLPKASPDLLAQDQAAEDRRAAAVQASAGPVSPGLVHFTGKVLFNDLWLRPDLAPRDRSLVTVSALIAQGQVGQIPFHLNRAMDNGLTQEQAGEVIAHIAFYAGWPNAFSAVPVAAEIFKNRH